MFNKRGWTKNSFLYFILGFVFLYVGLMPFFTFPFSFSVSVLILKIVLAIEGLIILFESFKAGMGFKEKWWKVILGLVFFVFAAGLLLVDLGVLPGSLNINDVIVQIAVVVYSVWMIMQAFMQEE